MTSDLGFTWDLYNGHYRVIGDTQGVHMAGWHETRLIREVERLRARVAELEELVDDLTLQSTEGMDGTCDSGALTAYADGLRDMAARGRVRITHDVGRRVVAEVIKSAALAKETADGSFFPA